MIRIGDIAPNFKADTQNGEVDFHEYLGDSWGVLCSHPRDFTPVCTTELGALAKYAPEFAKRNVKVAALSVDSGAEHAKWIPDINKTQQCEVSYPIFADADRKIAHTYNMIHDDEVDEKGMPLTVRAVYIVDPTKKVRLIIIYPASCGRNFDEIIRCVDSLQLTTNKSLATPVNWKHGEDVIVGPSVSDEDATKNFGEFRKVLPYLRYTKAPAQ